MTFRSDEKASGPKLREAPDAAGSDAGKAAAAQVRKRGEPFVDSADRRTELASDRTVFAAERTYAAWIRTGLQALASGVVLKTLLHGHVARWIVDGSSVVLLSFAMFAFSAGVWREFDIGRLPTKADFPALPRWLLIALNGVLILLCIAILIGLIGA
jgi:putative membrane protein